MLHHLFIIWSHNRPEDFSDEGEQDIAAEGHIQELENANIAMALANATQQCMTLNGTDTPESENEDECDNFFEEGFEQQFDDDVADWVMTNDEMLVDGCGLSAEELLGEDFEREAANSGELEVSVVGCLFYMYCRKSNHGSRSGHPSCFSIQAYIFPLPKCFQGNSICFS